MWVQPGRYTCTAVLHSGAVQQCRGARSARSLPGSKHPMVTGRLPRCRALAAVITPVCPASGFLFGLPVCSPPSPAPCDRSPSAAGGQTGATYCAHGGAAAWPGRPAARGMCTDWHSRRATLLDTVDDGQKQHARRRGAARRGGGGGHTTRRPARGIARGWQRGVVKPFVPTY